MYIMCVCLLSALSRRVGALQISIIIIMKIDICGHKAALNSGGTRDQELCESRGGRSGLPVPNSPYGLCGRKATLNLRRTAEL